MAASKCSVTPERVRKILSSFLSDETKKTISEEDDQTSSSASSVSQTETISPNVTETQTLRSREAFFLRVETFSPLTWFAKPEELSAPVCAQYGWENTDIDMLRCISCKAFLCGKLPSNTDQESYKEACKKLKTSITAGHEKMCSWSTNPAPDWYMQVPHYDPDCVRQDFHERYKSLKAIREKLPDISYDHLSKFGFDSYRCSRLPFLLDQSSDEMNKKPAALAVTGWSVNDKKDMLICQHCRRQAGLWNFSVSLRDSIDTDTDPPSKKPKLEVKDKFDPLEEHRTFCPWIKLKEEENSPVSCDRAGAPVSCDRAGAAVDSNGQSPARSGRSGAAHDSSVLGISPNPSKLCNSNSTQSPDLNVSCDSNISSESIASPDSPEEQKVIRLPGWVRSLKIIAPTLLCSNGDSLSNTIKKSPMVVGLRSIRRLFHDWATPKPNKPV